MKAFEWIARISAGIGLLSVVFGLISSFIGIKIFANQSVNYFHVANSFFLITIILYLHHIKHK